MRRSNLRVGPALALRVVNMKKQILAALFLFAAACTTTTSGPGDDMMGDHHNNETPDADTGGLNTQCGHMGDPGNALGVGKYCDGLTDCFGLNAGICATLGDPNAHFCTKLCSQSGDAAQCGDNASCECQGGQCGCTPTACL